MPRSTIELILILAILFIAIQLGQAVLTHLKLIRNKQQKRDQRRHHRKRVAQEIHDKLMSLYHSAITCINSGQVSAVDSYAEDAKSFIIHRSHYLSAPALERALKVIEQILNKAHLYKKKVSRPTHNDKEAFKNSLKHLVLEIKSLLT